MTTLLAAPDVWTGVLVAAVVLAGLLALGVVVRELWRSGRTPTPTASPRGTDEQDDR